jgi:hypothetical protein
MALGVCACATNNKVDYELLQINTLSSPQKGDGSFQGLEFLAKPSPGTNKTRVNILYLHGIGYTEDRTADALASDFLSGIARAYDLNASDGLVSALCGEGGNSLFLNAERPVPFRTILPDSQLQLSRLACMDKQTLDIGEDIEFVLYRVFWDTVFWDALQYPHVGQDDDRGTSEVMAQERQKYNRILKDDLVNYGFSDAVMYLGEAGGLIREAVRGAMCVAATDAAGDGFASGQIINAAEACAETAALAENTAPFAFVTESLGSKVIFDVMRDVSTDGRTTVHDTMIAGSETFMLANQIALFGLSDLGRAQKRMPDLGPERPSFIAISEVNDFLSYEIIPFLEQLYRNSYRPNGVASSIPISARPGLVREFGFNVVDVRTRFADKIIPVVGSFVDPKDAHTGHAKQPELMKLILCGAVNGKPNTDGCLAVNTPD